MNSPKRIINGWPIKISLPGRDGARWHLIEVSPYRYNFSSLESQIAAANKTGIQVIWDYFHYGYPDDLDIYSPQFIERFSAFCRVLTEYLLDQLDDTELIVCPVNEISFFSWIRRPSRGFSSGFPPPG
jgi:hypothetical protein